MKDELNIWRSIEIYCIACGFKYDEYLAHHANYEYKGVPLYEEPYNLLDAMFNKQMELEMGDRPNETKEITQI